VGIGGAGSDGMFDGSRLVPSEARTDDSGGEAAFQRSATTVKSYNRDGQGGV
jgi:hypothetical protein